MRPIVGGVPEGDDFLDRKRECNELLRALETSSVLLLGLRRTGKTAILNWCRCRLLREKSRRCEWVPGQFSLKEGLDWIEAQLRTPRTCKRLTFIWDEFVWKLRDLIEQDGQEARRILNQFRTLREDPANGNDIRFVLGGSTSLRLMLDEPMGRSLADLKRMEVGSMENPGSFIDTLSREGHGFELDRGARRLVAEQTAGIPFFIQIYLEELAKAHGKGPTLSREKIIPVYCKNVIGSPVVAEYFMDFYRRLDLYAWRAKTHISAARRMLSAVAAREEVGEPALFDIFSHATRSGDRDRFMLLLADLENDYYLARVEGPAPGDGGPWYRFRVPMMRDWWRRWHPPEPGLFTKAIGMSPGGRPMFHCARTGLAGMTDEVEVCLAMLEAIVDFSRGMGAGPPIEVRTLNENTYLCHREGWMLVATAAGYPANAQRRILKAAESFEDAYGGSIPSWSGVEGAFPRTWDLINEHLFRD